MPWLLLMGGHGCWLLFLRCHRQCSLIEMATSCIKGLDLAFGSSASTRGRGLGWDMEMEASLEQCPLRGQGEDKLLMIFSNLGERRVMGGHLELVQVGLEVIGFNTNV